MCKIFFEVTRTVVFNFLHSSRNGLFCLELGGRGAKGEGEGGAQYIVLISSNQEALLSFFFRSLRISTCFGTITKTDTQLFRTSEQCEKYCDYLSFFLDFKKKSNNKILIVWNRWWFFLEKKSIVYSRAPWAQQN